MLPLRGEKASRRRTRHWLEAESKQTLCRDTLLRAIFEYLIDQGDVGADQLSETMSDLFGFTAPGITSTDVTGDDE